MLIHVTGLQKAVDRRDKGATLDMFGEAPPQSPPPAPKQKPAAVSVADRTKSKVDAALASGHTPLSHDTPIGSHVTDHATGDKFELINHTDNRGPQLREIGGKRLVFPMEHGGGHDYTAHPHAAAGQTQVNPKTGKTIKGGQFAPKSGTPQGSETTPQAKPETPQVSGPLTFDQHNDFIKRLFAGEASSDELQQHADAYITDEGAIKADLGKHKVDDLLKMIGGYVHDKKKSSLVDHAYHDGLQRLALGRTISYQLFGKDTFTSAARKVIAGVTDADIKKFAEDRAERIAARKRALTDPQTYDEFQTFIHYRGESKLTPEQRVRWDDLQAEHNRGLGGLPSKPKATGNASSAAVAGAGITVKESVHTKHGYPIWIAQLPARVDRDKYNELNAKAKELGGYYSSYGSKDNHGFTFKSKEAADKFAGQEIAGADKPEAEPAAESAPAPVEAKRNPTADKLRTVADRMRERAEENLGRERATNTAKRAREAGYAEEAARRELAMANTLQNVADAIETGEVKHLNGLTSKAQVEALNTALSRAHWAHVKARQKAGELAYNVDAGDIPTTASDVDHTDYPYPYIHGSYIRDAAAELAQKSGKKRLAARLQAMPIGDGYVKNSEHIRTLQEAAEALKGGRAHSPGAYLKDRMADYDRLHRMGIKDLPSLRAALREFLPLRSDRSKPDPIKEKERALIGRRIPGYFPTPRELARDIVRDADIRPGMQVLEPNGGKGNIADVVRDEHPDADLSTVEPVQDLRDILTAKGHKLVGHDFLDHGEQYDRIVMNPPFENRQDVEHVRHAYNLLKPGGRMVAVMSEGPFGGSSKKDEEFRDWLMSHGGRSEKLPDGSFTGAQAERQTGVSTRKVIIDKPREATMPMSKAIVVAGLSKATDKPGDKRPKYHGIAQAIVILGIRKAVDARDASTGDLFSGKDNPTDHTRCRICGRKLRDDVSRRRGVGPECWEKIGHHAAAIKKMPHPSKVPGVGNLSIDFDKEPEAVATPSEPQSDEDAYLREKYGTRPVAATGRYLDRKHLQDLRDQIERKQAQLDRLNGQQDRNGALPGTFVTGRSGVSASYSKKLNRQLDRTIDTAVNIVALTKELPELKRRLELYESGRINEQGRTIDSPSTLRKQIAGAESILSSGMLKGKPLTAEDRSAIRDILKSAKERLKRIKPEDYAPEDTGVEKSVASIIINGLRAAGKKSAKTIPSTAPGVTAGKTSAQAPIHEIHSPITGAMQSHKFTWHQVAHRTEKGPGGEYGHFSHLLSHANPQAAMEKMRTHLASTGHTVSEVKRNRITQGDKTKHVYQFQAHKDGQMHTFTAAKMDAPVSASAGGSNAGPVPSAKPVADMLSKMGHPVSKSTDDPFGAHLSNLGFKNHSFSRSGDTFTHTMDHHSPDSSAADLGNLLKSRGHSLGDNPYELLSRQAANASSKVGPNRPTHAPSSSVRLTSQYKGITHHWNINKVAGNRPGGPLRERPELPIGKEPKMMAKAVVVVMNRRLCRSCGRPSDGAECYACLGKALVGG
jgi:hypothetical protein